MAHHHIYSPISWQKSLGYATKETIPWDGPSKGKPQCREAVSEQTGVGFYQCRRVGVVEEDVEGQKLWFCRQHSLAERERREVQSRERYKAKMEPRLAALANAKNAPRFQAALQAIAAGHNDARGLAVEVLREAGVDT